MNLERLRAAGEVHLGEIDSAALVEGACLPLDIDDVLQRVILLHGDKLLRILIGKGIKKDAVDHAEDGRICADAKSERERSDGGKGGIFAEHAHGVTQILPERFNRHESPHLAGPFFQTCLVAELTTGRVASLGCLDPFSKNFLLAHNNVEFKFILKIPLELRAIPKRHDSPPNLIDPCAHSL